MVIVVNTKVSCSFYFILFMLVNICSVRGLDTFDLWGQTIRSSSTTPRRNRNILFIFRVTYGPAATSLWSSTWESRRLYNLASGCSAL